MHDYLFRTQPRPSLHGFTEDGRGWQGREGMDMEGVDSVVGDQWTCEFSRASCLACTRPLSSSRHKRQKFILGGSCHAATHAFTHTHVLACLSALIRRIMSEPESFALNVFLQPAVEVSICCFHMRGGGGGDACARAAPWRANRPGRDSGRPWRAVGAPD